MSKIKHRYHVCLVAAARVGDDVEVIAGVGHDQVVDDAACQSSNRTLAHITLLHCLTLHCTVIIGEHCERPRVGLHPVHVRHSEALHEGDPVPTPHTGLTFIGKVG